MNNMLQKRTESDIFHLLSNVINFKLMEEAQIFFGTLFIKPKQ
jgi:hypothetical protein